jgi:hypothetical protein
MVWGCIPLSLHVADVWSAQPGPLPYVAIVAAAQMALWGASGFALLPLLAWMRTRSLPRAIVMVVASVVLFAGAMTLVAGTWAVFFLIAASWAWALPQWRTLTSSWLRAVGWSLLASAPLLPLVVAVWLTRQRRV